MDFRLNGFSLRVWGLHNADDGNVVFKILYRYNYFAKIKLTTHY